MASPVRFPSGLSTFSPRSILASYPIATSPRQISISDDFIPYRAGDYTVTTAVAGTATTVAIPSGCLKLAVSASATDTIFLQRGGLAFQFGQGNQLWFDFKVCNPRTVLNSADTNHYYGLADGTTFALSSNFIGFVKPSGGSAVNFVIKKAGTTTTFSNVADLALPSGIYGDANAVNGTLNSTVAANAFTAVSVATAGAGYQVSPLILSTATSGQAGYLPVGCQLGSTAYTSGNPAVPVSSTAIPYGSLASPLVTNPGAASFTNSASVTTYLEASPIIDLQFYFNGKGSFIVGINGRQVMAILGDATQIGSVGISAGGTATVSATNNSFYSATQVSTALMPYQPAAGSPFNLVPLLPLGILFGVTATTATAVRQSYVFEYNVATELN